MRPLLALCSTLLALASLMSSSAVEAQPLALGDLVVADDGADAILAVDPVTGAQRVIASGGLLVAPHGVAVDPTTLRVFVADRDAAPGGQGAVIRIDPAGYMPGNPAANQQVVSSGGQFEEPSDVFVERGGTLLVADSGGLGGVIRVDPATGAQTRVFDFAGATGVAADIFGTVYAPRSIGNNEVRRLVSGQSTTQFVSSNGFFNVNQHIAFEPNGTFVVVDVGVVGGVDGQVIRVNPDLIDTGNPGVNQTLVSNATNLVDPRGVAVDNTGDIYVTDPAAEAGAGAIYRVDPQSGTQTLVATGAPLDSPLGIDIARRAPRPGDIVVADGSVFSRVVLVDSSNGGQQLVRSFAPQGTVDVEIDENGDVLVLLAQGGSLIRPRVMRVDPTTGLSAVVHAAGPSNVNDFGIPGRMVRDGTHLFVGDSATFVSPTFEKGAIFDVNLANGTKTMVTGGGSNFRVLAIGLVPAPDGDFVVGTTNSSFDTYGLVRVDRVNLGRNPFASGGDLLQPFDLVVDPDPLASRAYVAARIGGAGGTGAIVSVDTNTGGQTPLTDPGDVNEPVGIAFDNLGQLLVSHRKPLPLFQYEAQILRIDPEDPDPIPVVVTAGGLLVSPEGLAVYAPEPSGMIGAGVVGLVALVFTGRKRHGRRTNGRAPRAPAG